MRGGRGKLPPRVNQMSVAAVGRASNKRRGHITLITVERCLWVMSTAGPGSNASIRLAQAHTNGATERATPALDAEFGTISDSVAAAKPRGDISSVDSVGRGLSGAAGLFFGPTAAPVSLSVFRFRKFPLRARAARRSNSATCWFRSPASSPKAAAGMSNSRFVACLFLAAGSAAISAWIFCSYVANPPSTPSRDICKG